MRWRGGLSTNCRLGLYSRCPCLLLLGGGLVGKIVRVRHCSSSAEGSLYLVPSCRLHLLGNKKIPIEKKNYVFPVVLKFKKSVIVYILISPS